MGKIRALCDCCQPLSAGDDDFAADALVHKIGANRRDARSANGNVRDSVQILARIDDPATAHDHIEHSDLPSALRMLPDGVM